MKQLIIIIATVTFGIFMNACSSTKTDSTSQSFKFDTTTVKTGESFYQCPMHPSVISEKPGDCPECGMALEKRVKM